MKYETMTARQIRKELAIIHERIDHANTHSDVVYWQRKELEAEQALDQALESEAQGASMEEQDAFGTEPVDEYEPSFEDLYSDEE